MRKTLLAACGLLSLISVRAEARGVSPYLPLHLDPAMERQIERILILAGKPALKRPIAAAAVLDALPQACRTEPALCQEVRHYLSRYMRTWSVTDAEAEVASSGDTPPPLANRYGIPGDSEWVASVRGYWQPSDYALLNIGGIAYEGEVDPDGSFVSLGFDRAQLDLGFRPHWLSPMTESSMLLSTHAQTMPSVTVSNYVPLTRWGFQYEAFAALMSESDRITFRDGFTSGRPRLAGLHLSIEPASGWSLGVNRVMQYGGGERPGAFGDLMRAFFDPSRYDNDEQFGNQAASITSAFIFPGKTPFTVYFEYAGEDTSNGKDYLLGNAALSAGIRFPRLWRRFDLTYEFSEWQNGWYISNVFGDGLTHEGHVIGHWAGDERIFNDDVGAQAHMLKAGWEPPFGGLVELRLRTLANESYSRVGYDYERAQDVLLRYSRAFGEFRLGAEYYSGRDVFDESFSRASLFVRYVGAPAARQPYFVADPLSGVDDTAKIFVEAGTAMNSVRIDLDATNATRENNIGGHLALGVRRAVSDRSDLGARVELDEVDGHTLLSLRAIDYRYRFQSPLAINAFVGASRYDLATPAYGLYFGAGVQWRNLFRGWDLGLDVRTAKKVARDHLLLGDPSSELRPDSFYTVQSVSLALSRSF